MSLRRSASNVFLGLGVALLMAALFLILAGPVEAQTTKPPKDEEPSTQSVYYPDPCDVTEPGSWTWYLLLCFVK